MLAVEKIDLHYGAAQALRSVSFTAKPGSVTCVLGRNGVGKTSLIRAIVGQQPVSGGTNTSTAGRKHAASSGTGTRRAAPKAVRCRCGHAAANDTRWRCACHGAARGRKRLIAGRIGSCHCGL